MNEILIIHILVNRDAKDSMPRFLIFKVKVILRTLKEALEYLKQS